MKTLRVALTTAGALAALVGGAETATWGLDPLSTSMNATAPQIVASETSSSAGATPNGVIETASQPSGAAPPPEVTPAVYDTPPEPPTDVDSDGPRDADGPPATTVARPDSDAAVYPRPWEQEAPPGVAVADRTLAPQPGAGIDASKGGGVPAGESPD